MKNLGYPAEDVQGFIENETKECKCVGCWKVYGDETYSRRLFAQYKSCKQQLSQALKDTDGNLLHYLGTELSPITMLVMMESIQNGIVENGKRGKATWLYMDCLQKNTTKVRNIKSYLFTILFNAGSTMDSYYRAMVNYDMPQFAE